MKLWEAKDIVRSHFGGTAFPTIQLDYALQQGRRTIEAHANFWWQQGERDFSLAVNKQDYPVYSGAINIPNFKDIRAFSFREPTGRSWGPVAFGDTNKEELDALFGMDDTGAPSIVALENDTIYVYPPKPNKNYPVRLYRYVWTDNPSNLGEDDLLKFFPMALVYAALSWGYEMELKDLQGASYWKALLGGQPFGRGGELAKLKKENFKRGWRDLVNFTPRTGATSPNRRASQGYGR